MGHREKFKQAEPGKGDGKQREPEKKKMGAKGIFLRVIIFWILVAAAGFACSEIQLGKLIDTGKVTDNGGAIPTHSVEYNMPNYILGAAIFLIAIFVISLICLRKVGPALRAQNAGVKFLVLLISLVLGFFTMLILVYSNSRNLGISSKIVQGAEETITLLGWPIAGLAGSVTACFKGAKKGD